MMKTVIRSIMVFPSGKEMKKDYDDREEFLGEMSRLYDILRSDKHYLFIARSQTIKENKAR